MILELALFKAFLGNKLSFYGLLILKKKLKSLSCHVIQVILMVIFMLIKENKKIKTLWLRYYEFAALPSVI